MLNKGFISRAINVCSYAILLAGFITIASCAYMMVVSYSSLPYWDGWVQVNYAADGGNPFALEWLWSQLNEHRMPIPKLFLLADLHWFHATQVFLLSSIFVIQFLHLLVLSWSMWVFGGWRGAVWRTGVGLAAFCLFCLSQWENLTWGMQVCFVLPGLFASLSFVGLLAYWLRSNQPSGARSSNWKYLLLSIAAALGATWSYVNGNLLWPMLVAAAVLLRLRLRVVLGYVIAGALSAVLYFNDYTRPLNPMSFTEMPVNVLKFLTAYFGSSWISGDFPYRFRLAEAVGLIGLAVSCFLIWRLWTYVRNCRTLSVQLVLISVFCVGTGALTSIGRAGFGIIWAFNSRYQTVSLLFWCCLGLLLLGGASALQLRSSVPLLLSQVIFFAIMLVAARYAKTPLLRARVRGFKLNAAAMALVTSVPDAEQLRWALPRLDYVPSVVRYMRQWRLSVFDEPNSWLLGKPLESVFKLAPSSECTGEL